MKTKAKNNKIQLPIIDGLIAATAQENSSG